MHSSTRITIALTSLACLAIAFGLYQRAPVEAPAEVSAPARGPAATTSLAPSVEAQTFSSGEVLAEPELPQLLTSGNFEAAVRAYDDALDSGEERDIERARAQLFAYASRLIDQDRPGEAAELLRLYTDLFFQDTEAMLMMADALGRQGLLADSLDYLVNARNSAYLTDQINAIDRQILVLVRSYEDELNAIEDRHAITALYQMLYNQYPENGEFTLGLARSMAAVGRPEEAMFLLQQLQLDPGYQQRAQDMMVRLEPALQASAIGRDAEDPPLEIPLIPHGQHYSIRATVDGAEVSLLLDTGASITTLTPAIVRRISARSSNKTITLQTANGPTRGTLYRVRRFALGQVELHNFELAALPLPGLNGIDGLLGTDFLRLFHYTINNQTDTLVLAPVQIVEEEQEGPG